MTNPVVLLFHSVDDRELLSLRNLGNIHPASFRKLLDALKGEFDIVSLEDVVAATGEEKSGRQRLLAITFDDGPKSYITRAMPVMQSLGIPSACFLITDCVGDRSIYWRYLYNCCIHAGRGRELAAIVGSEYGVRLGEKEVIGFTRGSFEPDRNERIKRKILEGIMTEEEYRERERDLFLSFDDLNVLRADPLVGLGIHTRTHPVLSGLTDVEIREEISCSLAFYRETIGDDMPMFSVPFGRLYRDYDERTVNMALDLSVRVVLSAYGGDNPTGWPLHNVRRVPVREDMLKEGVASFIACLNERRTADDYLGAEKRLQSAVGRRLAEAPQRP